jgi:Holliday junction resolvase
VSIRRRGFAHERDLTRRLWERGLAVIRAPASGSKAKRVLYPDLIAIYKGRVVAFEVKTVKAPRSIYIEPEQVEKLVEFCNRAGGEPYIAVKVVGSGEWLFIPIQLLERTESGTYKISRETLTRGFRLEALVSELKGVKKLTEFTQKE